MVSDFPFSHQYVCHASRMMHRDVLPVLTVALTAFRDRGAGRDRNQGRSTDEAPREGARGGFGARVRGGKLHTAATSTGDLN